MQWQLLTNTCYMLADNHMQLCIGTLFVMIWLDDQHVCLYLEQTVYDLRQDHAPGCVD